MKTKNATIFVTALMLALSGATTCSAASRALNDAQVQAAPKDNPGVKTVRGYLEEVALKDSEGKPLSGETKKAMMKLLGDHGVKECTVWMDANGVGTWEAPAAINDDGSFVDDTVITGMNENKGRTETRKKGQLPTPARSPSDTVVPTSGSLSNMIPDAHKANATKAFAGGCDYYIWQEEGTSPRLTEGIIRIDELRYARAETSTNIMVIINSRVRDATTNGDPQKLEKTGSTSIIFFLPGSDITGGTGAIEVFFTDPSQKKVVSNILAVPMPVKK